MNATNHTQDNKLFEIAMRIKEMRGIFGLTPAEMAEKTEVAPALYQSFEEGRVDFPFSFIHKCALVFGVGLTDLLEGTGALLSSYTVTRKGKGRRAAKEDGIELLDLAPQFRGKIAEPLYVTYEYSDELQGRPIALATHSGQEFDYVLSGKLKVQVGGHIEELCAGDSIYYNSATPHGMIASDGQDCTFLAIVLAGESKEEPTVREASGKTAAPLMQSSVADKFVACAEDEKGSLKAISFKNADEFNFAFDIVDALGGQKPDATAMVHIARDKTERIFTFRDFLQGSSQAANYFKSLGIKRGDKVMLVLKRHYQYWFAMLGLHKIGAIAIPATYLLQERDLIYRIEAAGVSAIICTEENGLPAKVDAVQGECPTLTTKIVVGENRAGWHNFDAESKLFSRTFARDKGAPCGDDTMVMMFTSGTTGYPKISEHTYRYPLGHYHTAKYWHCAAPGGLHLTISDTGWAKSLWGKIYGEWMCESGIFVYDFERFDASDILPMFKKYGITTFCAPPTMLRMMIKEDLSKFDLFSVKHMTTAGEALNPEVYQQFERLTGLKIMEGFGQTETTLMIGNLYGEDYKIGSMGKPVPLYDIALLDPDGAEVGSGKSGEICIRFDKVFPCGLFKGYYNAPETNAEVMRDGYYHTGDIAWRDEDGFLWYLSRIDDVIKSSGYRIGPFEIESVIMELPYVLECGVSGVPDEERGQIVKASIVLTKGTAPTDALKKEIQSYVKLKTAPYKYPRVVEFRDELPKTISGKIQRNKL